MWVSSIFKEVNYVLYKVTWYCIGCFSDALVQCNEYEIIRGVGKGFERADVSHLWQVHVQEGQPCCPHADTHRRETSSVSILQAQNYNTRKLETAYSVHASDSSKHTDLTVGFIKAALTRLLFMNPKLGLANTRT